MSTPVSGPRAITAGTQACPSHLSAVTRPVRLQSVLIADADLATSRFIASVFASGGIRTVVVSSAAGIHETLGVQPLTLIVIDLHLPGLRPIDLKIVAERQPGVPLMLMCPEQRPPANTEARQLGAHVVVGKPLDLSQLALIRLTLMSELPAKRSARESPVPEALTGAVHLPAAGRWADYVIRGSESEQDLRTLGQWARFIGRSYSTLCEACQILHIRPINARDFARILRSIQQGARHQCDASVLLDVNDRRTLRHLIKRSGLSSIDELNIMSAATFVLRQRFIPQHNDGIQALREMLSL